MILTSVKIGRVQTETNVEAHLCQKVGLAGDEAVLLDELLRQLGCSNVVAPIDEAVFRRRVGEMSRFIRRHGAASVFLARFTAVVRAFVPLVAGILRMSSGRFYMANVLSALVWAPLHVFPGVLAEKAISVAGPHATEVALLVLAALVLASIAWHLLRDPSRGRQLFRFTKGADRAS